MAGGGIQNNERTAIGAENTEKMTPSFAWSEADLMQYLAQAWSQRDPAHIKVIGRLRVVHGRSFGYLEDLHHAETGLRLPPVIRDTKASQVFVKPSDMRRFQTSWGNETFASAELDLSPLQEREKRDDMFACIARPQTLEPLNRIPESWWGIQSIESEAMPLVIEKARQAIDDQLNRETSDAAEALRKARSAIEETVSKKKSIEAECRRITSEIAQGAARVEALDAELVLRRNTLENRLRELEAFLREKGERMVALDLVDRADLEKLFPPIGTAEAREGHHFRDALDGDIERLASYVQSYLWRKGVRYTRAQLLDFITLLRTNDLIVLAGDSGSGKTSLVKSFASAVGGRCTVVPVKPNWASTDDLLGYYNPIERRYHPSQFLMALLEAAREPEIPHFICLDEMNLARVEYYFADFLSLLETRAEGPWIALYSAAEERQAIADNKIFLALEKEARNRSGLPGNASFQEILMNEEANSELRKLAGFQEADTVLNHHAKIRRAIAGLIEIPAGFSFPSNVWIIGAINVDETTHYLSPKILDRAHVMRFRNPVLTDWDEIEKELGVFDLDVDLPMNMLSTEIGIRSEYPPFDQSNPHVNLLVGLARNYLDPLGIEFGLRAIRQSLNYIQRAEEAEMDVVAALNNVVLHKVLPKIILDTEKASATGQKRRDLLIGLRDSLAQTLARLNPVEVTDSAVDALDQLISRADGNNGIANFWAR